MSLWGDHSDFIPSHQRPMSQGEQWIVDRIAESFLETGAWPKLEKLTRDALRAQVELPEVTFGVPVRDFIWRPDNDGTVVLSIPGFWRSAVGSDFVEKFVRVVLLCRDTYLGEGGDEDEEGPKITSEDLRFKLGLDDATVARVHALLPFEYFLTSGGGATSNTAWFYRINQLVARFRNVQSVEDYLEDRAKIIAPWPISNGQPTVPIDVSSESIVVAVTEDARAGDQIVDPRMVFVVHGRDNNARDSMFAFLEDLGLHPLEWNEMVRQTGKGTPHTLRVIEVGFTMAKAFVVLMTPDDEARLHADLQESHDPDDERILTCQPRPNVMFEAGRAFGTEPDRTILVEIGKLRRVSDLEGLNVVRLGLTKAPLMALADRLEAAGCPINRSGPNVFDPARFANLPSHHRAAGATEAPDRSRAPIGRLLASQRGSAPTARLTIKLWDHGNDSHLLEIANRGGLPLNEVEWQLPDDAGNWSIKSGMLPAYPIPTLAPQKYVRVPVTIYAEGPAYVTLTVRARTDAGQPFEMTEQLSIYG